MMTAMEALRRVIDLAEYGLLAMKVANPEGCPEREACDIVRIVAELELLHPEADRAIQEELEG